MLIYWPLLESWYFQLHFLVVAIDEGYYGRYNHIHYATL